VLVRSEAGEKLAGDAAKVMEVEDFPAEREEILRGAVGNKKKRVVKQLAERGNESSPLLYLKMDDARRESFMEGGPK
jgi:hypothetical protein